MLKIRLMKVQILLTLGAILLASCGAGRAPEATPTRTECEPDPNLCGGNFFLSTDDDCRCCPDQYTLSHTDPFHPYRTVGHQYRSNTSDRHHAGSACWRSGSHIFLLWARICE